MRGRGGPQKGEGEGLKRIWEGGGEGLEEEGKAFKG